MTFRQKGAQTNYFLQQEEEDVKKGNLLFSEVLYTSIFSFHIVTLPIFFYSPYKIKNLRPGIITQKGKTLSTQKGFGKIFLLWKNRLRILREKRLLKRYQRSECLKGTYVETQRCEIQEINAGNYDLRTQLIRNT